MMSFESLGMSLRRSGKAISKHCSTNRGTDPGQVGEGSAGQSGDSQALSSVEDASDESVEELAESEQALEAAAVDGVEDGADHPERPAPTYEEFGRPDDVPARRRNRDAA
jgi:hypothetical protein